MSETLRVSFRIDDGIITRAIEERGSGVTDVTILTGRRDIEDAVARVVNTPVSGKGDEA